MDGPACEASQAVQVALNIRPLITSERIQGCKDCITVVPGEPQVQIGVHTFTFDHVYGSSGTPLSVLFSECVGPLVEGLFHGYNATVLAYGQTGSGKTFTMGTGYTVGGSTEGVIPQVMKILFSKIETLSHNTEFHLRVSYIEILKEEIHDLLDPSPPATGKLDGANGSAVYGVSKVSGAVKPPIQIRETPNGGITISGITETVVNNASEMAFCLEQGSLCRATGSTNMNTNSSRSHAIFTVTLEQRRKWNVPAADSDPNVDDIQEDFLCAKLHLVDLAGSERAKRTGADGLRFKEGVHINRGLLALGNVISALGDDKKRKGGHVPYRDSKLTRLLQDSLGGNSKTVMIACVSPADSNAEETLNTLKYANRARNIQNKPVVNRDPMTGEMQRMRQQMDLLQAELLSVRTCGNSLEDVEMLKKRIAWLESCNADLRRDLESASGNLMAPSQYVVDLQLEKDCLQFKLDPEQGGRAQSEAILINDTQGIDVLKKNQRRICKQDCEMQSQSVASQPVFSLSSTSPCLNASALDPHYVQEVHSTSTADDEFLVTAVDGGAYDQAKELEHTLLQDRLDRELQELNKHLEQKEAEMKTFAKSDTLLLKQHFEKKLIELEDEKRSLQRERDTLVGELETITTNSDEHTNRMQEVYQQKLKVLETQILELKKRQENHSHLLRQKQRSDEAAKRLQDEIQRIKSQKVQLQHKIKLEAEQFRFWKASREKEVLQLRKEGRRTEYEMHKLQALNQRQKMVLQRKTEEAAMATRRLKELLEARKSSVRNNISYEVAVTTGNSGQGIDKGLKLWLEQELEVTVRVHEVRSAYEKQAESRVTFAKELRKLQEEEEIYQKSPDYFPERRHGDNARACASLLPPLEPSSMSPNARRARISLLESIVNSSSAALVSMASQLSEAEERERTLSGRARWQHLRTLGEAKNLLQLVFNAAASSRCQLRDKEDEMKEMREKMAEMEELFNRMNVEKQCSHTDQTLGVGSAIKIDSDVCAKIGSEDVSSGFRTFDMKQPFLESFGDLMNSGEHASLQNRVVPYSLRQGSRGLQSSEIACFLASDGLEGESDMDISDGGVSDEDWEDRTTRCTVRKNREGADKSRLRREGKSLQTDRKFRIVLKPGQSAQEAFHNQVSGCRLIRPPAGERVFSDNESKSQSGTEGRCSCTSLSGCKTRKCECKAAGGLCGPNCGCKASKCANRENLEMEADPSAVATAVQMEMAEAVATLRLDKERRRVSEQGEAFSRTDTTICELLRVRGESTRKAQRVLAVHGAALLESALREGQQEEHLLSGWRAGNECGADSPVRRTPLGDIGNKKMKPRVRSMFKHRRRLTRTSSPPAIFSGITRPDFLSETGSARAVSVHFAAKGASPTAPRSDELDMCSAVPCQHSSVQTVSSELLQAATSGGEKTSSGLLAVSENVFGSCSLVCQTGTKISAGISSPTRGELRDGEPKDTDKENRIIG